MGTVPDWITAIATVIAVGFAALAARAAGLQLELLRAESSARAREARMNQARLVFWKESRPDPPLRYGFRLINASNEPLVGTEVRVTSPGGTHRLFLGALEPTGSEGVKVEAVAEQMSTMSKEWFGKAFVGGGEGIYGPHAFRVDLFFQDAGGRHWHRADDMSLTEVEPGALPELGPFRVP